MRLRAVSSVALAALAALALAQAKLPIPDVAPAVKLVKALKPGMTYPGMEKLFPKGTGLGEVFWQQPERGRIEGNTIQFRGTLNGRIVFMRDEQRKQLLATGDAPEAYRATDPINGLQLQLILSQQHTRERGQRLIAMLSKSFGKPSETPRYTSSWKNQLGGWTAAWRVNGRTLRLYEIRTELYETRLELRFGPAVPVRAKR